MQAFAPAPHLATAENLVRAKLDFVCQEVKRLERFSRDRRICRALKDAAEHLHYRLARIRNEPDPREGYDIRDELNFDDGELDRH